MGEKKHGISRGLSAWVYGEAIRLARRAKSVEEMKARLLTWRKIVTGLGSKVDPKAKKEALSIIDKALKELGVTEPDKARINWELVPRRYRVMYERLVDEDKEKKKRKRHVFNMNVNMVLKSIVKAIGMATIVVPYIAMTIASIFRIMGILLGPYRPWLYLFKSFLPLGMLFAPIAFIIAILSEFNIAIEIKVKRHGNE